VIEGISLLKTAILLLLCALALVIVGLHRIYRLQLIALIYRQKMEAMWKMRRNEAFQRIEKQLEDCSEELRNAVELISEGKITPEDLAGKSEESVKCTLNAIRSFQEEIDKIWLDMKKEADKMMTYLIKIEQNAKS